MGGQNTLNEAVPTELGPVGLKITEKHMMSPYLKYWHRRTYPADKTWSNQELSRMLTSQFKRDIELCGPHSPFLKKNPEVIVIDKIQSASKFWIEMQVWKRDNNEQMQSGRATGQTTIDNSKNT